MDEQRRRREIAIMELLLDLANSRE